MIIYNYRVLLYIYIYIYVEIPSHLLYEEKMNVFGHIYRVTSGFGKASRSVNNKCIQMTTILKHI